jgi:hypothetical protein
MKHSLLTLLLFFLIASGAWGQAPCADPKGRLQEVPEGVEVLQALKNRLRTVMTKSEAAVIDSIHVCSPISGDVLDIDAVVALRRFDTGAALVLFGYSSQVALMEVGRATAIARLPGVHRSYLEGFIRYRATPLKFGELPMTAEQFAIRLGQPGLAAAFENRSDLNVQTGNAAGIALILFVLAHEFAHHVHEDVLKSDRTAGEKRADEAKADSWAASKLVRLGVDPVLAALSMLLFNQLEQQSNSDEVHPPPLQRALALVTDSERTAIANPSWIENYLMPVSTPETLQANVKSYVASLTKLKNVYQRRIEDQHRLATDNAYLKQQTVTSTSARIDLAIAYATGARPGISQDWELARTWMHAAQADSEPYEYDYRTDAQVLLAFYSAAPGGDMSTGCSMLRKAAQVKHLKAAALLQAATAVGQCPALP